MKFRECVWDQREVCLYVCESESVQAQMCDREVRRHFATVCQADQISRPFQEPHPILP